MNYCYLSLIQIYHCLQLFTIKLLPSLSFLKNLYDGSQSCFYINVSSKHFIISMILGIYVKWNIYVSLICLQKKQRKYHHQRCKCISNRWVFFGRVQMLNITCICGWVGGILWFELFLKYVTSTICSGLIFLFNEMFYTQSFITKIQSLKGISDKHVCQSTLNFGRIGRHPPLDMVQFYLWFPKRDWVNVFSRNIFQ